LRFTYKILNENRCTLILSFSFTVSSIEETRTSSVFIRIWQGSVQFKIPFRKTWYK